MSPCPSYPTLGFENAEAIRETILADVAINQLEPGEPNEYGERYQATVVIEGPSGVAWRIRTG